MTPRPCQNGDCTRPVKRSARLFCSPACYWQAVREQRHDYAAKRRQSYQRSLEARVARYATKGVAYQAGYNTGYRHAYAWWQRQFAALRKGRAA